MVLQRLEAGVGRSAALRLLKSGDMSYALLHVFKSADQIMLAKSLLPMAQELHISKRRVTPDRSLWTQAQFGGGQPEYAGALGDDNTV